MLKDSDYILAHSHESFYKGKPIGVRVFVAAGGELNEDTKQAIWRDADKVFNAISNQHYLQDEELKAEALEEKQNILKLFEGKSIFVEEVKNEYGDGGYYAMFPWFIITTPIGHIKIGWRKRVINIDWTHTLQKKTGEELFPNEGTTKSGNYSDTHYIHAWGYDKAKEYLEIIHAKANLQS